MISRNCVKKVCLLCRVTAKLHCLVCLNIEYLLTECMHAAHSHKAGMHDWCLMLNNSGLHVDQLAVFMVPVLDSITA